MPERITFKTADEVTIVGDWYTTPTMIGAIVLFHMMRETKTSWAPLQSACAKRGIASLAIDLRGHGESTKGYEGAVLDHREFTDAEHRLSLNDAYTAVDWVANRGLDISRIALGGASFGANLAIATMVSRPSTPCGILLSPGADFRGIRALEESQNLPEYQALYIAAAEQDEQSFKDCQKLFEIAPVEKKIFLPYKGPAHGTDLFKTDSKLPDKIADWLLDIMRG